MAFALAPRTSDEPWTKDQIMDPADLAKQITDGTADKPIIFNIGPVENIKTAIEVGPAKEAANLDSLRAELTKLPKDAHVVIYCGCCPFEHCPNIRPAFTLMDQLGFVNGRLLDLSHNLKVDWIAKGYPIEG